MERKIQVVKRVRMNALIGTGKYGIYSPGADSAQIIDVKSLLPVHPPLKHPLPIVRCEAVSLDGRFAVTSCNEKTSIQTLLQIWDLEQGTPLTNWMKQLNWISGAVFSSDGKWLAVCDFHNNVQLFGMDDLQQPPSCSS